MKKEIYNYLTNKLINGVPILNHNEYEELVSKYNKEDIIDTFVEIFMQSTNKPFPSKNITLSDVEKKFLKLQNSNEQFISTEKFNENIWMKHEYSFDIGKCLGISPLGHYYNDISDYFHRDNRYNCSGYNRVSPKEIWNGYSLNKDIWKKKLKGFVSPLFRNVNNLRKIEEREYLFCFRLSSTVYNASQFKPNVAKLIYDLYSGNGNVIDISMGWGDRLAGFFTSSNTKKYVGTDPNKILQEGYKQQIETYNNFLKDKKEVEILSLPAEDVEWKQYKDFDLIFSSPPYFSTELYAKNTEWENLQSWKRFTDSESWLNGFLFKTLELTYGCLKHNGILALNIFDVGIDKNRIFICSNLMKKTKQLGYEYLGYYGMRMKQRPKKITNQEEAQKFMASCYVEPIWIFQKK